LILKELTYEVIGSFFTVYNALGYGFLESACKRFGSGASAPKLAGPAGSSCRGLVRRSAGRLLPNGYGSERLRAGRGQIMRLDRRNRVQSIVQLSSRIEPEGWATLAFRAEASVPPVRLDWKAVPFQA